MSKRTAPPDPQLAARIEAQAERVAEILGVDPESVMFSPREGVALTPAQADALLAHIDHLRAHLRFLGVGDEDPLADPARATREAAE